MCRNIRTLFNFEPPASDEEIRASALQFVRKLSGFTAPSKANEAAFHQAVEEVGRRPPAGRFPEDCEPAAQPRQRKRSKRANEAAPGSAPEHPYCAGGLISCRRSSWISRADRLPSK